jgi:hypothetical protein
MIFMNRLASRLYHPRDDVDPEGSCPHEPGMHESFMRVPARRPPFAEASGGKETGRSG